MHVLMFALALMASPLAESSPVPAFVPSPDASLAAHLFFLDDVVIPGDWTGIWEVSATMKDCDTQEILYTSTFTDTICPGTGVGDEMPYEVSCTGEVNGSTMQFHCEGAFEIDEECTVQYVVDSAMTRTGETYESTSTSTTTYVGPECGIVPPICVLMETTGTRIAPAPPECQDTPADEDSWGRVKRLYR